MHNTQIQSLHQASHKDLALYYIAQPAPQSNLGTCTVGGLWERVRKWLFFSDPFLELQEGGAGSGRDLPSVRIILRTSVYYCVLLCTTLYYCVLLCTTEYYT